MLKKVLILAAFASLFACNKEAATADKQVEKDANGDDIVSVPFFELAKGDTLPKGVYRLKSEMVDTTVTVLFTTERPRTFLKSYGDSYNQDGYIADIGAITRVNNNAPLTMGTYIKIPVDLNEGAGGYFINLYYKKTTNSEKALCYIQAIVSNRRVFSTGLDTKLGLDVEGNSWIDLNDRAGGPYIFLEGSYVNNNSNNYPINNYDVYGKSPIRDIMVISTGDSEYLTSYSAQHSGWKFVTTDLNKGVGGAYIYLGYKF